MEVTVTFIIRVFLHYSKAKCSLYKSKACNSVQVQPTSPRPTSITELNLTSLIALSNSPNLHIYLRVSLGRANNIKLNTKLKLNAFVKFYQSERCFLQFTVWGLLGQSLVLSDMLITVSIKFSWKQADYRSLPQRRRDLGLAQSKEIQAQAYDNKHFLKFSKYTPERGMQKIHNMILPTQYRLKAKFSRGCKL